MDYRYIMWPELESMGLVFLFMSVSFFFWDYQVSEKSRLSRLNNYLWFIILASLILLIYYMGHVITLIKNII